MTVRKPAKRAPKSALNEEIKSFRETMLEDENLDEKRRKKEDDEEEKDSEEGDVEVTAGDDVSDTDSSDDSEFEKDDEEGEGSEDSESDPESGEGDELSIDILDGEDDELKLDGDDSEDDEEPLFKRHAKKHRVKREDIELGEDFKKMFDGESLTEEFQDKAKVIFETVLVSKINDKLDLVAEDIHAAYEQRLEENVNGMTEKLDEYLDSVVSEWFEVNNNAITAQQKVRVAEETIAKVRSALEESYITLPDVEFKQLDEERERAEAFKKEFGTALQEIKSLKTQISEMHKAKVIDQLSEDMTEMSKEKFKTLLESVEFKSEKDFVGKATSIKDIYLTENTSKSKDMLGDSVVLTENKTGPKNEMDVYADAITRLI